MTVQKNVEWEEIDSTDVCNVFHTLEGLVASALDNKKLSKGKYYVSTVSGVSLYNVRKIREELEPTGEDARYIRVEWTRPFRSEEPLERVVLTVSNFTKMEAEVEVWGSNANETYGFIETTKNRVNAGIERSKAAGWPIVPSPDPVDEDDHVVKELAEALAGTTRRALTPATTKNVWRVWWKKFDPVTRHPLWSTLIAGLIVLALTIWLT